MATELWSPVPQDGAAQGDRDPFAVELAISAPPVLAEFNRLGVLTSADVHVAATLGALAGVSDPQLLLATAHAVRAPRTGHVFVDLLTVAGTVEVDGVSAAEIAALPWPAPAAWVQSVAACEALVGVVAEDRGQAGGDAPMVPLRLHGSRLYLDRYWREEQTLARALRRLDGSALRAIDLPSLGQGLQRLLPGSDDELQRVAAASGVLRGLTVIAGGPGTGKTTTVAKVLTLLHQQAAHDGTAPPLVALCAPTGKAAVRLQEAVHENARTSRDIEVARQLLELRASTIHRLLGWLPGGRFRHTATNHLPHDLVIVDETSMVALSLMVRLVEAVRPDAQLILVGDPDQLTAIEAGAVLRDIVGPAIGEPRFSRPMRSVLGATLGAALEPDGERDTGAGRFGDGVVVLRHGHRFGAGIGALADAIRLGDADGAIAALRARSDEIAWLANEAAESELRGPAVQTYGAVLEAARAGNAGDALAALERFRLLCAHRHGPHGVARWGGLIERWLIESVDGFDPAARSYAGCPLLITENDYELRLSNGDVGVVVAAATGDAGHTADALEASFERDGEIVGFAPSRLGATERLYAMTIHKSQGSQFDVAAVVLPEPDSRILTRELLYTAVTRARTRLILVASEESVRAAVERPVARATGLRELLWDG